MTSTIQVRLDAKLKRKVEKVFEDIGIDTPTAVRIFLTKVASSRGIPFELKSPIVTENGFTREFEEEILQAAKEKDFMGPFKSAKEGVKALRKSIKQ